MKTAFITGGSRGIGRAAVEEFCRVGYRVYFTFLNNERQARELESSLRAEGHEVAALRSDAASVSDAAEAAALVARETGRIDALVNNAGVSVSGTLQELTDAGWERLWRTNASGPVNLTRAFLPLFIAQKSGSIVNVSSVWGIAGASCEAAYSATKAAVIGFTKAMSRELGPSGIRVNCVAPGVIDTEMNACHSPEVMTELANEASLCRVGRPEEVARVILALSDDAFSFVTGQVVAVDGGLL